MATKKTTAPTAPKHLGRPFKELDKEAFEKLCEMQCTEKEICAWFGVDDMTLCGWCRRTYGEGFAATFAKLREGGKASLRRAQWTMAQSSVPMAIFLGKNILQQSDDPARVARDAAAEAKLGDFVDALTDAAKKVTVPTDGD